jgi:hypothetical protein
MVGSNNVRTSFETFFGFLGAASDSRLLKGPGCGILM